MVCNLTCMMNTTHYRRLRMKRVVRVPAISMKMADIPPDDYSWRKYGQKPIKGSPHPRYMQSKFSLFFFKAA